jgi:hypothetical protein
VEKEAIEIEKLEKGERLEQLCKEMVNDMIENIAKATKAIEELVNIIVNIDVLLKIKKCEKRFLGEVQIALLALPMNIKIILSRR